MSQADYAGSEWQIIECHFCGTNRGPFPWRKRGKDGVSYACEPCGEREMLDKIKPPSPAPSKER